MQRNRPFIGSNAFRTLAIGAFILAVIAVFVVVPGGAGDKGVIRVTMWSSGEKMNYLRDIVEEYNREKHVAPAQVNIAHPPRMSSESPFAKKVGDRELV